MKALVMNTDTATMMKGMRTMVSASMIMMLSMSILKNIIMTTTIIIITIIIITLTIITLTIITITIITMAIPRAPGRTPARCPPPGCTGSTRTHSWPR